MTFALLVCALLLLTVVYFVALVAGEIAFWLISRLVREQHSPITALTTTAQR